MNSFKLKVTIDPAKHAVPHADAESHAHGYTCGCVVSQAVNDAVAKSRGRFRRWEYSWADTGLDDTVLRVLTRDGRRIEYEAVLPESFERAREAYDHNRSSTSKVKLPVPGSTRTLTYKRI